MISVLIPFGGDCEWRARALEWTRSRYAVLGWEVLVGDGNVDEWRKADAVQDALRRAHGDILVIADGDCWCDDLEVSVAAVEADAAWSVPFLHVHRLNQAATEQVYAGAELNTKLEIDRATYRGVMGGGVVVIHRDVYEQIPMDRRFVDWGGEDDCWGWALRTIVGEPERCDGPLWHLWHPLAKPADGRYANEASVVLAERYEAAWQDPAAMRTIIEEARWESNASSFTR